MRESSASERRPASAILRIDKYFNPIKMEVCTRVDRLDAAIRQVIESAYDAATGGGSWNEVGTGLKRVVGAQTASLWVGNPAAGRVEMLYTESISEEASAAYASHFYAKDPWVEGFTKIAANTAPGALPGVALTPELLSESAYRHGEFYTDFARHLGLYHIVGGVYPLGAAGVMPLGLHRPEGAEPFGEAERRIVETILPHLHHAVRIKLRLGGGIAGTEPALGAAALDAFPAAAIVVDAGMRIVHANLAAEQLTSASTALRMTRRGPPPSPMLLEACRRSDAIRLSTLVRVVALMGGPGSGMRLPAGPGADDPTNAALAVVVTPLPSRLLPQRWAAPDRGTVPGYALILARELGRRPQPAAELLLNIFGLTQAEADVAVALAGGSTTEEVARQRAVGPATIRSQVRIILEKAGARNLRELESILASLPGG